MFESVEVHRPPDQDDLGYVLGWFCGGILIVGIIVAAIQLAQGSRRKAFQAFVLPFVDIAWLFLIMEGVAPPGRGASELQAAVFVILLLGGLFGLPLLGVLVLRKLPFPAPRTARQLSPIVSHS